MHVVVKPSSVSSWHSSIPPQGSTPLAGAPLTLQYRPSVCPGALHMCTVETRGYVGPHDTFAAEHMCVLRRRNPVPPRRRAGTDARRRANAWALVSRCTFMLLRMPVEPCLLHTHMHACTPESDSLVSQCGCVPVKPINQIMHPNVHKVGTDYVPFGSLGYRRYIKLPGC